MRTHGFSLSLHHTTFIAYLRNHQRRLDTRIKHVTSKKFRTWVDDLTNTKSYENPENGLDFYNNYKDLLR